jgi:hypothetical protein
MSEQRRTFEAEIEVVKAPKLVQSPKPDQKPGKPAMPRGKRGQRTFSRDTVERLIDWFKQG